jgi:hypothetical protein
MKCLLMILILSILVDYLRIMMPNLGRYEVMIPVELLDFYPELEEWDFERVNPIK